MEINITPNTNLEDALKVLDKVEEIEKRIQNISNDIRFVDAKELASMLGCSVVIAREIFGRADFPVCDYGKSQVVFLPALCEYFMKPVKKDDTPQKNVGLRQPYSKNH